MGPIGQLVHVQIYTGYSSHNKLLIVNILIRWFTLHAHANYMYKDVVVGKTPG